MRTKVLLTSGVSLFLFCTAISTSFAQAEDYVTTSQINAANGVAGLNASQQVTADVNNNNNFTKMLGISATLSSKDIFPVRFFTGKVTDPVDIFYNQQAGKDPWGNKLDADTLYFSNHHGGNNYKFVGNVAATESISTPRISLNGHNIIDPIPGGYEDVSSYNDNLDSSLVFLTKQGYDNNFVRSNTLMIGGDTRNANVGIKAECQTTSGGDEGGVCYQFINMSGSQGQHRSGTGATESTNMELRTSDNSPIDVIGGNYLTDDNVVKGSDYHLTQTALAGANTFVVKGTFGCGIQDETIIKNNKDSNDKLAEPLSYQKYGCVMTGVNVIDYNGKIINTVNVTPGAYDPQNDTTVVQLPTITDKNDEVIASYKLAKTIPVDSTNPIENNPAINIIYYSSDGTAYGVRFGETNVEIYPALTTKEENLLQFRMALWTNYANGMYTNENPNVLGAAVDMPNYYYGYYSGGALSKDKTYSFLNVETYYYPGGDSKGSWKTVNNALSKPENVAEGTDGIPGKNNGDTFDYQLTYTDPVDNKTIKHNSNYHRYSQPALFLGLTQKNFNTYTLQAHLKSPDSFTREFDSEWDYWIRSNHDYEVSSKGLTLSWLAHNDKGKLEEDDKKKKLTAGSYMLLLSGVDIMPTGLKITSVWKDGGKLIDTDGGFSVFHWIGDKSKEILTNINSEQVINALGQAETNKGSYQLFSYMSNDGTANNSLHFGITKNTQRNLRFNYSPTCRNKAPLNLDVNLSPNDCSVLGQVIFDPLGYVGGIALGSGQGENTKLGLVVDKDSNVFVDNKLITHSVEVLPSPSSDTIYPVRFLTGITTNNDLGTVDIFYNQQAGKDPWGNMLDVDTLYFSNHHGGNNYKFVGNVGVTGKFSNDSIVSNKLTVNDTIVSDKLTVNKDITSKSLHTSSFIMSYDKDLNNSQTISPVRFLTGITTDPNLSTVDIFYNQQAGKDPWNNMLDADTLYFSNHHGGNNYKFVGNVGVTGKFSNDSIVSNKLTVNDTIVSDKLTVNKDITSKSLHTSSFIMSYDKDLNNSQTISPVRFLTGITTDPNLSTVDIFYNQQAGKDPWNNMLDADTLYFSNHHGGNNYKFVGNVGVTGKFSVTNLHIQLSTPSSSSEACSAGDIKDDANYHYVCVSTNKWKRAALSDF